MPPRDRFGRRRFLGALAAGPWLARSARATDDGEYPERPIRLVQPSAVGGSSDQLARLIAADLGDALGQPVVVEARPGAAGRVAIEHLANSAPDGYTLLLANNGANAIVPAYGGQAPMPPYKALVPVMLMVRLPIVIAASPALGVETLTGLLEQSQRTVHNLRYASGGPGSTSQMAATLLFHRAGVHLEDVPYPGTAAAIRDVLSGEVPVLFTHLGTIAGLLRAGELHALALTGPHRIAGFPDIATLAESGFRGLEVTTWHGVMAPPGTPQRIVLRLHAALDRVMGDPALRRRLADAGMDPVASSPGQFASQLETDVRHWAEVVRDGEAENE